MDNTIKRKRIIVTGYGTVAREFIELVNKQKDKWKEKYKLELVIVGIAGSLGMVYEETGIDLQELLMFSKGSQGLASYAKNKGIILKEPVWKGDVLVECTPTNLETGEPALSYMKEALMNKLDIISISKGALVHSLPLLQKMAKENGCRIRYSGATAAALPTLDIGEFSLAGSSIFSIQGILNGTSNFILTCMSEENITFDKALIMAQEKGIAEKNPALDVRGLDSACKLLLIANGLFHTEYTLEDVEIQGIEHVTKGDMQLAKINGCEIKLVASAKVDKDHLSLQVRPEVIDPENPLIHVKGTNKGILFHTEEMGTICCLGGASHPRGAAAASIKDLINLFR